MIIAVTSYALSGEEMKARAAGCDDYVPKPFSPCCRKFVSTYLNRFVALHMSAFGGKADIQLFPIISVIGSNRNPVRKRRVRSERPPIQNQVLGVSGHLGEARQRIISAVIQATNSTAVVSLFVSLQISSQENIGRKLLDSETNGICRVVDPHIFDNTRP